MPEIGQSYQDFCQIVDGMPPRIKIYFDDGKVHEAWALRGVAYASDVITLVFNPEFDDDGAAKQHIRWVVFHEAFHVCQGFTTKKKFSGIDSAVHEGCATIFEQNYAGGEPEYGKYQGVDEAKLREWYEALSKMDADEYWENYRQWLYWDEETKEENRAYKTGTWIVDAVLKARKLDVLDLRDVTPAQIVAWFEEVGAVDE